MTGHELETIDAELIPDDTTPTYGHGVDATTQALITMYGPDGYNQLLQQQAQARAARTDVIPANTAAAYRQGLAVWQRYATAKELTATIAARPPAETLELYATWLLTEAKPDGLDATGEQKWTGYSPETASSHLSGAIHAIRQAQPEWARAHLDTKPAWLQISRKTKAQRAANQLTAGRGQAEALEYEQLLASVHAQPDTVKGVRDRCALLLAWVTCARSFEITSMRIKDLTLKGRALDIYIRVAKTEASERHVVALRGRRDVETLTVQAYQDLMDLLAGADPDSHLIRGVHASGQFLARGIRPEVLSARVKELTGTTSHGIRAGAATWFYATGEDLVALSKRGGWTLASTEMAGYIRLGDTMREAMALDEADQNLA